MERQRADDPRWPLITCGLCASLCPPHPTLWVHPEHWPISMSLRRWTPSMSPASNCKKFHINSARKSRFTWIELELFHRKCNRNCKGRNRESEERIFFFFSFKAVIIWVWDAPSGSRAWTTGPQAMALFCSCSIFKRQGLPGGCSHLGAGCQVCTVPPLSVSKPLMLLPLQTWAALTMSQNQPSSLKLSLGFGHCYDLSCSPSATLGSSST